MLTLANIKQVTPVNFISNASAESVPTGLSSSSVLDTLISRLDLVLAIACCLTITWLLFVISLTFVRRRFGDLRKFGTKANHNTSWRFNANREKSNNETVGGPFRSKVCVNYYGGSNGDSEHDMIHSYSQSSHYEDFAQHQLQAQLQQQRMLSQQPLYSNSHSTLNRRPLKSSISTSSTGESSTGSRQCQQVMRLNECQANFSNTMHELHGSTFHSERQVRTCDALAVAPQSGGGGGGEGSMTLSSNVPLISGAQSKINLSDQPKQRQQARRPYKDQLTFCPQARNEHIYDDVVYNQVIL